MNRKVITIHTENLTRLTPALVRILSTITDELEKPEIKQTQAGLVIYDTDWRRHL